MDENNPDLIIECPKCEGLGYYAAHNSMFSHTEDGECTSCPIQVECEQCEGKGKIEWTE